MSQHLLCEPISRHSRRSLAILSSFAASLALAIWLAWPTPPVGAADPAAGANPPKAPTLSDVILARAALTALDAEPELRGVNLVVSVVDRVAVIGGPVATARQAQRAEEVLRAVPGIDSVKNTCFVTPVPDPLLKAVADRLGTTLPERPVMTDLPGVLTGAMPPSSPFPSNGGTNDSNRLATRSGNGTVVALRPALPMGGGLELLGPPVSGATKPSLPSPAAVPPPTTAPGVLTATLPPESLAPAGDLLAAAAALRKTEPRFAGLTVDLRDGVLVIGGSAPMAADAWDFAAKLRAIPGVNRVAVGSVLGK
jgi:hypothetical protein